MSEKKGNLISIVITTKNEEKVIENLLKSIKRQTYKNFEILVIDNNSSDKTVAIAKKYTSSVFTVGPERSAQRNFGAKKAKGKFLLFLDADMVLEQSILAECVECVNKKLIAGCFIPEISFGNGFWAKVKAYERSFYIGDETIEAARFFKKKIFLLEHGYDEKITGPEDWDFSERVRKKYNLGRIRSFIKHNEGNLSLIELIKKKYYYSKKTSVYLKKNKRSIFSPKTFFFLRSSFYKSPKKILFHPILFCAMILMLSAELAAGAIGYFTHEYILEK